MGGVHPPLGWFASSALMWVVCIFRLGVLHLALGESPPRHHQSKWICAYSWCHFPLLECPSFAFGLPCSPFISPRSTCRSSEMRTLQTTNIEIRKACARKDNEQFNYFFNSVSDEYLPEDMKILVSRVRMRILACPKGIWTPHLSILQGGFHFLNVDKTSMCIIYRVGQMPNPRFWLLELPFRPSSHQQPFIVARFCRHLFGAHIQKNKMKPESLKQPDQPQ